MTKALLSLEVSGIGRYVFGTDALREIRGASSLLDRFNRTHMQRAVQAVSPQAETVFVGGGTALFLLPKEDAEPAVEGLERQMRDRLGITALNSAIVEVPADFDLDSDLHGNDYYRRLGARLVANKGKLPGVLGLPAQGLFRPCDGCGLEYAEDQVSAPGREMVLLCGVCRRKWDNNHRLQQELRGGTLTGFWEELAPLLKSPDVLRLARPETMDALARADGATTVKNNSLALIYADGDGLGTLLREAATLRQIGDASIGVHRAMLASVAKAIDGPLRPGLGQNGDTLPFDILLLGGDDLVLVTTAARAFPTAIALAKAFPEESTRQGIAPRLTLSLAVVFAHPHHPFRYTLELADGCLSAAKRERFRRLRSGEFDGSPQGLINYAFAGDAPGGDYGAYESSILSQPAIGNNPPIVRTMRPYIAAELERMLLQAAKLKQHGLPPHWLQALRETGWLDKTTAIRTGLLALTRMGLDPEHRNDKGDIARSVIEELAAGREVHFPWIVDGDGLLNVWPELIDLMPFAAAGGDIRD